MCGSLFCWIRIRQLYPAVSKVLQCLHIRRLYLVGSGSRADIATFCAFLRYCVASLGLVLFMVSACVNSVSMRCCAICFMLNGLMEPFKVTSSLICVWS